MIKKSEENEEFLVDYDYLVIALGAQANTFNTPGVTENCHFSEELHDFVHEDLAELYPAIKDLVKITVVEAGEHILSMFDKRIGSFAEKKFQRDGIEVKTGYMVVSVSDKAITMKGRPNGEISLFHMEWLSGPLVLGPGLS
ncbi:External alternative NADPH-ubiquinone oxidoreductase B2, mitochondrial [Cinnamomum micranthum f. kanehirae]|uniref:NADH:ubiquinone reductase (non-electrogenic) n=1 Tax=Cinnamomum micranthum f. kanehirae TaxID=337451 RepID=A0A443PJ94_9MAGN|nr:External alternative NADPH-ubiquinone oxidoreductase B2, mitochondrial [Cinnamomum micranthum f. kanehirae]